MESLLVQPDHELAVAIEAQAQSGVAQDVVDGAEAVIATAGLVAHERMATMSAGYTGGDFEQPGAGDGTDELLGIVVGRRTRGEDNPHRVGPIR